MLGLEPTTFRTTHARSQHSNGPSRELATLYKLVDDTGAIVYSRYGLLRGRRRCELT